MKKPILIFCILTIALALSGCTSLSESSLPSTISHPSDTSSIISEETVTSSENASTNSSSIKEISSEAQSSNESSKTSSTSSKKPTSTHKHSYTKKVVKATCEKGGYTKYTCKCGYSYKKNKTDKLHHLYVEWRVVKEATPEKEGLKECVCKKCGDASIKEVIPKKKLHKNVDPQVEIGIAKYTNFPQYRYKDCRINDKRSWGDVPIIEVLEGDGLRCTYYTKDGQKKVFAFAQPPEDMIWSYTIHEDGTFTENCVGAFS